MARDRKKIDEDNFPVFSQIIGGELPLSPKDAVYWEADNSQIDHPTSMFGLKNTNELLWLRFGRAAIVTALKICGIYPSSKIAFPSYHCKAVIEKIISDGYMINFYYLNNDLTPNEIDLRSTASDVRAVVTCSYFGSKNVDDSFFELTSTLNKSSFNPWVIEDRTMAIADSDIAEKAAERADFIVYSLRKSYPIPDGASIIACSSRAKAALTKWRKKNLIIAKSTFDHDFKEAITEKIEAKVKRHFWASDQYKIDAPHLSGLNEIIKSEALVETVACDPANDARPPSDGSIRYLLRRNFKDDQEIVSGHSRKIIKSLQDVVPNIFPITECTGIAIPILVENRENFLMACKTRGLFLPVHWPRDHRVRSDETIDRWYNQAVSLPTLPYQTSEDIDYMIKQLLEIFKK